uniref:Uncharacterized protein n=1 Tax=Rousettus aegyptiacus TaxID=9407 RepID=A0A7J8EZZ1_ROUAE|nr:hypothetical protein HJG63_012179 [Rousettus aegyptiacus]
MRASPSTSVRSAGGGTCLTRCSQWGWGTVQAGSRHSQLLQALGVSVSFMGGRSVSSQVGSTLREAGLTWGPGGARLILWLLSSALRVHRLLTLPLPYWPGSLAMWRGGSAHVLTVPCRGHITEGVW